MSRTWLRCIVAVFCAFLFLSATQAFSSLLGPVYPGSVEVEKAQGRGHYPTGSGYGKLFYTKDSIEQVLAFYRERLGTPEQLRPESIHYGSGEGRIYFWIVKWYLATYGGVDIVTNRPLQRDDGARSAPMPPGMEGAHPDCFDDLFQPLLWIMKQRPDKNEQDFMDVCHRFLHLTWSYYPYSDEVDASGRPLPMDKYLVQRYESQLEGASLTEKDLERLYMRMQELAMAGRTDELEGIARQMTGGGPRDDWEGYVALLEEIDRHAYRTRIMITYDPSAFPEP